jgi:uncharacterized protein DUF1360
MLDWSPWFRLTLSVLATWRVSHLIAQEDGPFDVIVRLRSRAGDGVLGKLMDCPYCLSLWIAAPLALLLAREPGAWCVAWLAISGGSSLLEKFSRSRREPPPLEINPTIPILEGAYDDVLLRTETRDDDELHP